MILWLYSIEPPFYAALNDASREMDEEYVLMLGPFCRALHIVLSSAEAARDDKMLNGTTIIKEFNGKHPLGVFAGSFLLFKCVKMSQ